MDPLVMEVTGAAIRVSSPRIAKRFRVGRDVAALLLRARAGVPVAVAEEAVADPAAISTLVQAGLMVDADNPAPEQEPPWSEWGTLAWSFHNRIRDTDFVSTHSPRMESYLQEISTKPRPSSVKAVGNRVLLLPRVRTRLDVPFLEVLQNRRTHRDFHEHRLSLEEFSDMLHYCFAPQRFADAGELGTLTLRAYASGGARHENEAYVTPFNVASVRPGLYHYDPIRHGLALIRDDVGRAEMEALTHEQGFFRQASFGVLTAAVAERMSWKYPHPAAYKMLLHNAGTMVQVFSMTATALGLGAAITAALRDGEADELLGLRQPGEFVTFALACGRPVTGEDGMPQAVRTPEVAPDYY